MVTKDVLKTALEAAGRLHYEFETVYLKGVRDELWPGYYAAFMLGRLPELDITPLLLASLLEQAEGDDWPASEPSKRSLSLGAIEQQSDNR